MSIETEEELIELKRIGRIVARVLREMKEALRPGMTTQELDDIGGRALARFGAQPAPALTYRFPGATCISVNDEAAHGIPSDRVIRAGDLVNIDVSAELGGFFADNGASIPVPPIAEATQHLCLSNQRALRRALTTARAGRRFNRIGRAIEAQARHDGFKVIRNLCGHGLGRGSP